MDKTRLVDHRRSYFARTEASTGLVYTRLQDPVRVQTQRKQL
jgi:hypothetical protein